MRVDSLFEMELNKVLNIYLAFVMHRPSFWWTQQLCWLELMVLMVSPCQTFQRTEAIKSFISSFSLQFFDFLLCRFLPSCPFLCSCSRLPWYISTSPIIRHQTPYTWIKWHPNLTCNSLAKKIPGWSRTSFVAYPVTLDLDHSKFLEPFLQNDNNGWRISGWDLDMTTYRIQNDLWSGRF